MDLRLPHLRAFLAVAEELHFARAAARLGLTQPVVSRHVRALEEELRAPLLVRTSRHVELTEAGRAAIPHARALLDTADRLGRSVADAAAGATGVVTVGFAASTTDRYMRPLIEAMAQRWPGVTIQPRLGDVRVLLLRGELDAMVMRGAEATESVVELVLREEPVVAAVPAGHAFAERTQIGLEVYVPTDGNPSRVVLLRRAQPPTGAVAALLEVAEDVLGEASVRPERPSPPPLG